MDKLLLPNLDTILARIWIPPSCLSICWLSPKHTVLVYVEGSALLLQMTTCEALSRSFVKVTLPWTRKPKNTSQAALRSHDGLRAEQLQKAWLHPGPVMSHVQCTPSPLLPPTHPSCSLYVQLSQTQLMITYQIGHFAHVGWDATTTFFRTGGLLLVP